MQPRFSVGYIPSRRASRAFRRFLIEVGTTLVGAGAYIALTIVLLAVGA